MSEVEVEVERLALPAALTVCIDFKNPHAYLAKDLLYRMEDDLGVRADWLPYLRPALKTPPAPEESDDRGTRHRWHRARYVASDIQRYAKVRGLVIQDIYRQVDSSVAAMALLWAREQGAREQGAADLRGVIDALFAGHWEGLADIGELASVTAILDGAGVNLTGWGTYCATEGREELQQLLRGLAAFGVFNVPAMIVKVADAGPEIFYGRAHLPMVRWLLQGQAGPPPI